MGSSDEFVRGQRSLSGKTREIRGNLSEVMIAPAMHPYGSISASHVVKCGICNNFTADEFPLLVVWIHDIIESRLLSPCRRIWRKE